MKQPHPLQPDPRSSDGPVKPPSILDRVLPPDPPAPTRPTIPPPSCGTLPAPLPPVLESLGGRKRT
ncbi:MAG TPA: hypothetical protein VFZ21_16050 [Gemmatimonadaceae bacterium]|nr:hypothetical protein [Gemmatimonadaceae bacterium]